MSAAALHAGLLALAPTVGGGDLAFPTGPAESGVVLVRVVDRNRVPLAGALVHGVPAAGPCREVEERLETAQSMVG